MRLFIFGLFVVSLSGCNTKKESRAAEEEVIWNGASVASLLSEVRIPVEVMGGPRETSRRLPSGRNALDLDAQSGVFKEFLVEFTRDDTDRKRTRFRHHVESILHRLGTVLKTGILSALPEANATISQLVQQGAVRFLAKYPEVDPELTEAARAYTQEVSKRLDSWNFNLMVDDMHLSQVAAFGNKAKTHNLEKEAAEEWGRFTVATTLQCRKLVKKSLQGLTNDFNREWDKAAEELIADFPDFDRNRVLIAVNDIKKQYKLSVESIDA